jgi:hypothetical protein
VIKLICFVKRKAGLSRSDFREHWLQRHGPLVASLPDFRRHIVRYEQNCRLDSDYARDERAGGDGYDGVTVQWFETRRDFYAFAMEPTYKDTIFIDEDRFLDRASISFVLCEEPDIVFDDESARSAAGVKLIAALQRLPEIDRDAFRSHWATRHAAIFRDTPELARHVVAYHQNRRLDKDYERDQGGGFDGVTEQWFASQGDFDAFVREPAFAERVFPDERKFLVPERTRWMLTRAPDVIIEP